jgi:hypothetical protein
MISVISPGAKKGKSKNLKVKKLKLKLLLNKKTLGIRELFIFYFLLFN